MNFPIEVYTIIIECLLVFYFFHKEVRPVYPSRRYIILFCISLFAVIMLSTLYTPMFIRLVIISLFCFYAILSTSNAKYSKSPILLYYFCYVDVFRCYWCVCTFQTWNFNKWTFRNKWRTAYLQYHKQDYSSVLLVIIIYLPMPDLIQRLYCMPYHSCSAICQAYLFCLPSTLPLLTMVNTPPLWWPPYVCLLSI